MSKHQKSLNELRVRIPKRFAYVTLDTGIWTGSAVACLNECIKCVVAVCPRVRRQCSSTNTVSSRTSRCRLLILRFFFYISVCSSKQFSAAFLLLASCFLSVLLLQSRLLPQLSDNVHANVCAKDSKKEKGGRKEGG